MIEASLRDGTPVRYSALCTLMGLGRASSTWDEERAELLEALQGSITGNVFERTSVQEEVCRELLAHLANGIQSETDILQ